MRILAASIAIGLFACKSGGDKPAPPPAPVVPNPTLAVLPQLPAPPAAPAGAAWLGVNNTGLVALENGQFRPVPDVQFVSGLAVGPDGTLWVEGGGEVWKVTAAGVQRLPSASGTGGDLVPAGKDELWMASSIDVSHWNGGGWTVWKKDDITKDDSLRGFAIDGKGRAVEISDKHINVLENNAWRAIDLAPVGNFLPLDLVAGDDGKLYALTTSGTLLVIDGDQPSVIDLPSGQDTFDVKYFLRGPPGELYAIGETWFLVIRPADKGARFVLFTADLGIIEAGAVDRAGRVWLSGRGGFAVIDRAGQVTMYPPGTVPTFSAGIDAIAIAGAGPTLPAVGAIKKGSITGTVVNGASVVAGATIELCADPRSVFDASSTPCGEEPFHLTATTGPQGEFRFDGVPLGAYGFAILPSGTTGWTGSMREFCKDMQEGAVCDVGPLDLAQ